VVVRQFPIADPAASREQLVLRTLDGLGGLAPVLLGGDVDGGWSEHPTSLISWLDGEFTGIVDWSGAARGPRGYDIGWCRLDLVLLFDERIADAFVSAYEAATGRDLGDVALWDGWAAARSHDTVETWTPNYAPLGRGDLNPHELRQRYSGWTTRLLEQT